MKKLMIYTALIVALAFTVVGIQSVEAVTFNFWHNIAGDDDDGGLCDDTDIEVYANITGTIDDSGVGSDYMVAFSRDGDGSLIDVDTESVDVGVTDDERVNMQGGNPNPIDASPMYIYLYDVDAASYSGTETEANVANVQANGTLLAMLVVDVRDYIPSCANIPYISAASAQPAPQTGMISISQGQPVYDSAGGNVVRDGGGNELWLPQDYDGSGADTHVVMSSTTVDGRTWYEIWIGASGSTVWIPADNVTVVE